MKIAVVRNVPAGAPAGQEQEFELPDELDGAMTISAALHEINARYGANIAHYASCRRGICSGCLVRVDGEVKKACATLARDGMVIDALNRKKSIRDLICI